MGGGGGRASSWGVRVDVNGEVFVKIQKKILFFFFFWGGGGSDQGYGWVRGGSKVWGRWVMWGMGDVNQE